MGEEQFPKPEEQLGEAALTDVQPQVDEKGYLPDGTKPSYVQDADLAHEAANAPNDDRSVAALHREQGDTYHVDRGNNVGRDRHYDVARAIDTLADLKEDDIRGRKAEAGSPDNPEQIDDPERERIAKLVEIRAGAAKIHTALSGSVEDITQSLREVKPINAYADTIGYRPGRTLDNQDGYDEAFREKTKDLVYAQKFGVVSDRHEAEENGVEFTYGWPDKYNRWRGSLGKTVELDARSLLSKSVEEEGKVTFTVSDSAKESGLSDWTTDELSRLAEKLSRHASTFYARIESRPSIVLGTKDGHVVARAYFIVQVGDRYSRDLEIVELHDVDNILKLASDRLRPFTDEVDEGQRQANLVDTDAIKEDAYKQAETRNQQFIEKFKAFAPEFDDVSDTELHGLLKLTATHGYSYQKPYPENLSRKQELIINAMRHHGALSIVTDSDGNIVDHNSIRNLPREEFLSGVFERWDISGTDKVTKTTYNGSPWSVAVGRKVQDATDANMSPEEIASFRKRVLDIELRQSAA
jgi:hypothetical protein